MESLTVSCLCSHLPVTSLLTQIFVKGKQEERNEGVNGLVRIYSTWHIVGAQKTPATRTHRTGVNGRGPGAHSRYTGAWWAPLAEFLILAPGFAPAEPACRQPSDHWLGGRRGRQAEPTPSGALAWPVSLSWVGLLTRAAGSGNPGLSAVTGRQLPQGEVCPWPPPRRPEARGSSGLA